jgi:hypothetical protein
MIFKKNLEEVFKEFILKLEEESLKQCNGCESKSMGCNNHKFDMMAKLFRLLEKEFSLEVYNITRSKCINLSGDSFGEIFVASGKSMYPTINQGDILILTAVGEGPYIGDVIVFGDSTLNSMAVHRVIGKDKLFCYCRGDANEPVEKVIYPRIIGVVSLIVKKEQNRKLYDMLFKAINTKLK